MSSSSIFLLLLLIILVVTLLYIYGNNENYVDTYSIDLQADALNRMARWNTYHSRRTSNVNYVIAPPLEKKCYYWQF